VTHDQYDAPTVSPNGKYIAFGSPESNKQASVHVMGSDGSNETIVSPSAASQRPIFWTPDNRLVFVQFGTSPSLWVVPISKGKPQGRAVSLNIALPEHATILGVDRSGALYYGARSSTGGDIFTVTMDPATGKVTSDPTPLPVDRAGANVVPRWSPDSRQLAYS